MNAARQSNLSSAANAISAGDYESAEKILDGQLSLDPSDGRALQLYGISAMSRKNYELAVQKLTLASSLVPTDHSLMLCLADCLQEAGRYPEALIHYDQAIALNPFCAEGLCNRANVLAKKGLTEDAIEAYRFIINTIPHLAEPYFRLSRLLAAQRNLSGAQDILEIGLKISPSSDEGSIAQGIIYYLSNQLNEAERCFTKAIEINSQSYDAFCSRGLVYHLLGKYQSAISDLENAMRLGPITTDLLLNIGNSLIELENFPDAVVTLKKAITHDSKNGPAYSSLALAFDGVGEMESALKASSAGINLEPNSAKQYFNRGVIFHQNGDLNLAIEMYDKALSLDARNIAMWNKSLALLAAERFQEGWMWYERRWNRSRDAYLSKRQFFQPLWFGQAAPYGSTILLHAEQGLGDVIQFSRFVHQVSLRGYRVILEVPRPLVGILRQLPGISEIVARGDEIPPFDLHCPLMSLPFALNAFGNFPFRSGYLKADPADVEIWRVRLGKKLRPRVGLVWNGGALQRGDSNRSIALASLIPWLPKGADYFCLQKEIRTTDARELEKSDITQFIDIIDQGADRAFKDTAALITHMDTVVTVDTSIAHLSGAMGKSTNVIVGSFPEWRWGVKRPDNLWYESIKVFRQLKKNCWRAPLEEVSQSIGELISEHRGRAHFTAEST